MTDNDTPDAEGGEVTVPSDVGDNPVESDAAEVDETVDAGGVDVNEDGDTKNNDDGNDDAADEESGDDDAAVLDEDAKKPSAAEEDEEGSDKDVEDTPADKEDTPSLQQQEGTPESMKSDKKRPAEESKGGNDEPLPTLPLKRARTAYFIFSDDKRAEVKQQHKGEGVAVIAKALGQLWSTLEPSEKEVYEKQAAAERARVSRDTQRLKDAGLWPETNSNAADGAAGGELGDEIVFPIGRIRKICKLDPEVKGMSKESALLITKATELFCARLGKECVTMAQMQNRRKLLCDDVVEVCSVKERFSFLKSDIQDLKRDQVEEANQREKEKENGKDGKGGGKAGEDGDKNLFAYFGKPINS